MRTITFHFDSDDKDSLVLALGRTVQDPEKVLQEAFNYLINWGWQYPVVDIYMRDRQGAELMAVYRARPYQQDDSIGYVIGAVFDRDAKKYGFHS